MSLRIRLIAFALLVAAAAAAVAAILPAAVPRRLLGASPPAIGRLSDRGADLQEASRRLDLAGPVLAAALAAVIVGLPAAFVAARLARGVSAPLDDLAEAAEAVAGGVLDRQVTLGGHDGRGRLPAAIAGMQHALASLVERVRASGRRLQAVETDTRAALAGQERAVGGFSAATQEISAAVAQITATSEHLLVATGGVMETAREAAGVADEGREGLERMTGSMQQLNDAMNAFTRKLATISQRASGITAVVTTIAKVAEQTNLLSVNATIEAEKAGESGRGFRIVAQEIRRLADQTALATKDIERLVRDMQAAVAGGTMEMDRFRNEVGGRIGEVAEVSGKLGRVIEPVQAVTRALEQVHEGMESQSQGARQIREAMESLRGDAAESTAAVAVFSSSLAELRAAIVELTAEAERFT
ncbi:MAG: methyl-accepting chemotaxis protein [Planctomycetes bacterium]|nr:methyl-accepting chemotaxis protein [Planctomycetota bacterium]